MAANSGANKDYRHQVWADGFRMRGTGRETQRLAAAYLEDTFPDAHVTKIGYSFLVTASFQLTSDVRAYVEVSIRAHDYDGRTPNVHVQMNARLIQEIEFTSHQKKDAQAFIRALEGSLREYLAELGVASAPQPPELG